jgi:protein-S-isoprenylcysteine O-methyltransferase Ste14
LRLGRRPLVLALPGVAVAVLCLVVLFALPSIGGNRSGRDITLWQVAHISPAVVTVLLAVVVAALAVTVVVAVGAARHPVTDQDGNDRGLSTSG